MLEDKLKELKKAIDAKRAEAATALVAFDEKKAELKNNPDVDITNAEDPHVIAADAAMKPYSQAADDLRVLEGQFERLALMEAAGGQQLTSAGTRQPNEIDRNYMNAREELGRLAANSDAYKNMLAQGVLADGSEIPISPTQITAPMDRKSFASLLTGTSDPAGGALNTPQRFPGIYDLPQLPLSIMQLITIGQTNSNAVEFVRLLARTINAAEVAEASTAADIGSGTPVVTAAQGGLKPESGLTFEEALEAVRTIAHWMPATRNQLADAAFLQTLVESEMLQGVERRAEQQILSGDGVAPNLRGILATPGRATYTQGTAPNAGEPRADAVHRIFTMLRLAGYNPSALAVNPLDWQAIRLSKDTTNNYIWGPPSMAGTEQIWGVPTVQTIGVTAGKAIAGEWKRLLFLVREGAKVLISDSHKDWFTRNLIALLAESRAVSVIPRPQAFGELTFV
ncbi:MAG: phage major capsid protein [Solirubrobacteraceae bacterium]